MYLLYEYELYDLVLEIVKDKFEVYTGIKDMYIALFVPKRKCGALIPFSVRISTSSFVYPEGGEDRRCGSWSWSL